MTKRTTALKIQALFKAFLFWTLVLLWIESSSAQQTAFIGGTIKHVDAAKLTINNDEVPIGQNGHFKHSFTLEKPSYVLLKLGEIMPFFLQPGDSLRIELDAEDFFGSFQINGRGQEVNRFILRETHKSVKVREHFNKNYQKLFTLNEKEYVALIDSLTSLFSHRFDDFVKSHPDINDYFVRTYQASILYSGAISLLNYPNLYQRFAGNPDFQPSDQFYSFLDSLDFNDPELLEVDEYASFLKTYMALQAEEMLKTNPGLANKSYNEFRARFQVAMQTFTDPKVRSEMLFAVMQPLLAEYNIKTLDDLMDSFRASCTNPDYVQQIQQMYDSDKKIQAKCEIQVFKTVDSVGLDAFIYRPEGSKPGEKRPALAFFHGGGWNVGKPEWGHEQCEHFASLGFVCISFEYRLKSQHHVTPVESIADAKSAIRWMRQHAGDLGIDPQKIVASGFSAGGHLAACTVMIDQFDEPDEDHRISPAANALMLWSAPVKIFTDNWFQQILQGKAKVADCDPAQHIRSGLPPAIIFQGSADDQVPAWSVEEFAKEMKEAGNRCDFHLYEGQTHLGWGKNGADVYKKMDRFLISIGFLEEVERKSLKQ